MWHLMYLLHTNKNLIMMGVTESDDHITIAFAKLRKLFPAQ